jgi:bifunctional pyridoxal-dependent enzyme with beta-cystathionase and maltose regulon repressor activities
MVSDHDTPTQRATINQLSVDELDAMLTGIRERRLQRVKKLEEIAKVKADEASLVSYMQFERAYKTADRYLKKLATMEARAEELMHKVRLKAMVIQFEVGETEDAAD